MNDTVKIVKQKNRGGFLKRLIRQSLIFTCLNKLSDRITKLFTSGILYSIFLGSDETDKLLENGVVGRFISRINFEKHLIRPFKVFFANGIEHSRVTTVYRHSIKVLLSLSIRSLGILLSTFGVYGIVIYFAKLFSYITLEPNESAFFWSAFMILAGVPLLLSGKSIANVLKTSRLFNKLFINVLGINEMTLQSDFKTTTYGTAAFILGTLLGLITVFISPSVIVSSLIACVVLAIILFTPEFGLLTAILLFPLISVKILAEIIIITTISYLIKVMRGKRNLKFRTADVFILFFAIFILSLGFTGDGGQVLSLYLICFIAVYFLISNLLVSRRLIKQLFYGLSYGAIASELVYVLWYILGNNEIIYLNTVQDVFETSLIGRESFGFFLVIILPLTLALFKASEQKIEKASLLVLLVLTATCIFLIADSGMIIAAYLSVFVYSLFATKKFVSTVLCFFIITAFLEFVIPFIPFLHTVFSDSGTAPIGSEVKELIVRNLFTGVGMGDHTLLVALNSIGASNEIRSLNLFEKILVEGGVFYLLAFLSAVFFILQKAFYGVCRCSKYKMNYVSAAFTTIIILFLFLGLLFNMWEDIRIFMLFWIVCGTVSAMKNVYGRFVYLKEAKENE